MTAIEFENISKQYRLGLVSTRTLRHDLNRWWITNVLHKEDPYLKIGETNDRSTKGSSEYVWALRDINFKVEQGDVVGIIGKNGAGKSTLLKLLSRVTGPTTGTIRAKGRIGSLLEVGTGFHPEMTGRENIFLNGAILGMTKQEISRKLDEIIDFSGCERYIDTPVKRYSSGMMVRLGFAVAAHLDPEILVVDEVLAVGDAEFQKKAIGKMQDVSRGEGRTVLFVSHNMASIKTLCHHGILLEYGQIKHAGDIESTVNKYLQSSLGSSDSCFDLVRDVKIQNTHFYVNEVCLNGKTPQSIYIDDCKGCFELIIEGSTDVNISMDVSVRLHDINTNLIASFYPAASSGRYYEVKAGEPFTIKENFELPQNLASGEYYLEVHLFQRNVEYLAFIPCLSKLTKRELISPYNLENLSVQGIGYLLLPESK